MKLIDNSLEDHRQYKQPTLYKVMLSNKGEIIYKVYVFQ